MSGFCAELELTKISACGAPANSRCPTCPAPENRCGQGKKVQTEGNDSGAERFKNKMKSVEVPVRPSSQKETKCCKQKVTKSAKRT